MSLITRLMAADTQERGPADDFWYNAAGIKTQSGEVVNPETAMRVAAVYASVRVITETIASLPLFLYKKNTTTGSKSKDTDNPLYSILHHRPNQIMTSFDWRELIVGHMALRGCCYSKIVRDGFNGDVLQLIPLHPDRLTVELLGDNSLRYKYRNPRTNVQEIYLQDEILRVPFGGDGVTGASIISQGREAIGLAKSAEKFGSKFFKNDARPGGVLKKTEGSLSEQAFQNLKESWQKEFGGEGRGGVAILEEGIEWQAIGMSNEDSQYIETRKYQRSEIASLFRLPPHMIGDLEHATFTNIEQQSTEFVVHCIRPWLVRFEQAFQRDLYPDRDDIEAEFNVDGLLRGDSTSRAIFYSRGILDGWLTRNEVREKENLNKIEGLDEPLVPLNMGNGATPNNPQQNENQPQGPQQENRRKQAKDIGSLLVADAAKRPARMFAGDFRKRVGMSAEENATWFSGYKDTLGVFFSQSVVNQLQAALAIAKDYEAMCNAYGIVEKGKTEFITGCESIVKNCASKADVEAESMQLAETITQKMLEAL